MKFDDVRAALDGIPYLGVDEGWELYQFVVNHRPERCLELGHAHGVSSVYLAAAMEEEGRGHLDTVDLLTAGDRDPNLERLLERTGLGSRVTIHREKNSYTWFLKKRIEARSGNGVCEPCYDFCFIDGAKNWTIDGLAYFLVDKLLRPGGWLLFDDYTWTMGKHPGRMQSDGITVRSLSQEEVSVPHIEAVYQLLVTQHPDYGNFEVQDNWWAWAQKLGAQAAGTDRTIRETRMKWHEREELGANG